MKEAIPRGFEGVQFESDSKLLVGAIHSRKRGNSEFNLIVNDIILLMSSSYVNFKVKFVRKQEKFGCSHSCQSSQCLG
jgi:hypothetical protein